MGKNSIPAIKFQVISVLRKGNNSPLINDFFYDCTLHSKTHLDKFINKFTREKIIKINGLIDEDDSVFFPPQKCLELKTINFTNSIKSFPNKNF